MPSLMLVNPRKRRSTRKARKSSTVSRKRRVSRRRTNPVSVASVRRRARRHLSRVGRSVRRVVRRRRRNPISMRSLSSGNVMKMLKAAAIGGAGAIAVDVLMAKINEYLPASLQPSSGPGLNDVVRVALTIVLGKGLSRMTKGASETAAAGALTVQMADLMRPYLSNVLPSVAGIGYMSPNRIIRGNARLSPIARGQNRIVGDWGANGGVMPNMAAFQPAGQSPLLSAYSRPGSASPLLSAARRREGGIR